MAYDQALKIADAANVADDVRGPIATATPGRTDDEMISVADGSYIIPADVVSSFGEGNTEAGAEALDRILHDDPAPPEGFAAGGAPQDDLVDIAAAGGEYVVPPAAVRRIGGGDLAKGHRILDALVLHQREKTIHTLANLPGPKS